VHLLSQSDVETSPTPFSPRASCPTSDEFAREHAVGDVSNAEVLCDSGVAPRMLADNPERNATPWREESTESSSEASEMTGRS
jgi:hypothetical protein